MINLTVRTIDSGNYYFTLEDQSTVLALKYMIRDSLHIELHNQRLIYSGRFLADDINLTKLDMDGKVIHMVNNPPPSPTAPVRGRSGGPYSAGPSGAGRSGGPYSAGPSGAGRSGGPYSAGPSGYRVPNERIRPETLNTLYTMNDTDRRVLSISEFILDITQSLHNLHMLQQNPNDTGWDNGFVRPRQREITSVQTPLDFINLYTYLQMTQAHFEPFRQRYVQLLRNTLNSANAVQEVNSLRAYTEMMNSIHHSLAHTYHSLSELSIQVDSSTNTIRLVSEPAPNPMRPPLPFETMWTNSFRTNHLEHPTTEAILGALGFDGIVRSNQNPGGETITFSMNDRSDFPNVEANPVVVISDSDDDQNDADSQGDPDVMIVTNDAQDFLQNVTPFFRQELPFPGTSQAPDLSEDRFTMPSVLPFLPNIIYDRFLFCESRHAHVALQHRRYHLTYQLEAQRREMSRNVYNSLSVLIYYVPGLTQDYVASMTHLLCLSSFPETYMNAALTLLICHFNLLEPHVLQRNPMPRMDAFPMLRDHHNSFALNVLMASNDQPVNYIMSRLGPFLRILPHITPMRPDLDLEASLRAYFNARLQNHLIGLTAEMTGGMGFILNYCENQAIFFIEICNLLEHHCLNRTNGIPEAMDYFMHLIMDPMAERVKPLFNILIFVLRNRAAIREEHFENMRNFVQVRATAPAPNYSEEIISISSNDSETNAQELTPIIEVANDDSMQSSLEMIVEYVSDEEESVTFEWICNSTSPSAHGQPVVTPNSEEPDSNVPPSGSSSISENNDAKAIAAGNSNASDAPEHNWEQSYVPIFKSDEVAQKAGGSSEPLSDAYLAGMPASKRRCVRRQRPPCNLEDFLTACVDAAGDSLHMTENDMRLALSVHMCNLGSTRFSSNEDVNDGVISSRLLYVRRYFNSDRPAWRGDDPNPSSNREDSA